MSRYSLLFCFFVAVISSCVTLSYSINANKANSATALPQERVSEYIHRKLNNELDFTKAKELSNTLANLIYQRFEFGNKQWYQYFIEASNMPGYGWDLLKYKIAKKILEGNSEFLVIFGGSSVTAGHDNYYNQSWPLVFERRMAPIFDAIGVKLAVHNIAQGANNCRPALNCYESMGGEHADFIGWEQSFNCGKAKDVFEQVARIAYWAGGVAHYSASGAFIPNYCAQTTVSTELTVTLTPRLLH